MLDLTGGKCWHYQRLRQYRQHRACRTSPIASSLQQFKPQRVYKSGGISISKAFTVLVLHATATVVVVACRLRPFGMVNTIRFSGCHFSKNRQSEMQAPKQPFWKDTDMRQSCEPKRMATILREVLAEKNLKVGHGEALDIVARQFGLKNWNVLAAAEKVQQQTPLPQTKLYLGWLKSGFESQHFEDSIDSTVLHEGKPSLRLQSKFQEDFLVNDTPPMVTLMQTHESPPPFLGKRITFSASVRCKDVDRSASIWLRINGHEHETLAFTNLEKSYPDGALSGSHEWANRQITFDVPENAHSLSYGLMLTGVGTAWFSALSFGEAGKGAALSENSIRTAPKR